jgi:hypothetical protein
MATSSTPGRARIWARGPSMLRISRELRLLELKPAARLPTAADRASAARTFARPTEGSRWSIPVLAVCGEQVDPSAMAEASCVEGTKCVRRSPRWPSR